MIGNATIDENSVGDRRLAPCLGGTGSILSLSLARFGLAVTWVGHIGSDAEPFLEPLRESGVEIVAVPCPATLRFRNDYPDPARPEARTQRAGSVPPPLGEEHVLPLLESRAFAAVAFGPLTPGDVPFALLERVLRDGPCVALDAQGYLRHLEADGSVRNVPLDAARSLPGGIGLLHVNDDEADLLALGLGLAGPRSATHDDAAPPAVESGPRGQTATGHRALGPEASRGDALRRRLGVGVLALTYGTRGSSLHSEGGALRLPAYPPGGGRGQGDATGCGDIFLAALLRGELRGIDLERSARFAAVAAGLNAMHEGIWVATAGEVERHLPGFP